MLMACSLTREWPKYCGRIQIGSLPFCICTQSRTLTLEWDTPCVLFGFITSVVSTICLGNVISTSSNPLPGRHLARQLVVSGQGAAMRFRTNTSIWLRSPQNNKNMSSSDKFLLKSTRENKTYSSANGRKAPATERSCKLLAPGCHLSPVCARGRSTPGSGAPSGARPCLVLAGAEHPILAKGPYMFPFNLILPEGFPIKS